MRVHHVIVASLMFFACEETGTTTDTEACSDSCDVEDAKVDELEPSVMDCQVPLKDCPAQCDSVGAMRLDRARECLVGPEALACWKAPGEYTADMACLERLSDGAVYVFSSGTIAGAVSSSGDFVACDEATRSIAYRYKRCD